MVKEVRRHSLIKTFTNNFSDFRLFFFLAIFTILIGITFFLVSKRQEIRQRAFGTGMEFGFTVPFSAVDANISLDKFRANVDTLAANNERWVRLTISDSEVASEAPNAVIPTATPTATPPPTVNTVLGLTSNPIIWNETNLSLYDSAIDYAAQKGLKVYLVANTPTYAKNYSFDDYSSLTNIYFNYLAARYKGKIAVWQIFNNANIVDFRDGTTPVTLSTLYLNQLDTIIGIAKNAIKSNDNTALVTTNAGGIPLNDSLISSWNQFFDGISGNLDFLAVGMYPLSNTTQIANLGATLDNLKAKYGKDVVVSDIGICTAQGGFSEADQGNYVSQALGSLKLSSAKLVLEYEMADRNTSSGMCDDTYGILRTDLSQKVSYSSIMPSMQPLPTPTPTLQPTDTPTPTPPTPSQTVATSTPIPTNQGILHVVVLPTINATLNIVTARGGKIILTATGGIDSAPLPVGTYYISFSYPKTSGLRTPKTAQFKILDQTNTNILGDFNTGKTSVSYQ